MKGRKGRARGGKSRHWDAFNDVGMRSLAGGDYLVAEEAPCGEKDAEQEADRGAGKAKEQPGLGVAVEVEKLEDAAMGHVASALLREGRSWPVGKWRSDPSPSTEPCTAGRGGGGGGASIQARRERGRGGEEEAEEE